MKDSECVNLVTGFMNEDKKIAVTGLASELNFENRFFIVSIQKIPKPQRDAVIVSNLCLIISV